MRTKYLYGMQRPRVVHSTRPVIELVTTTSEIVFPIDGTVSLTTPDAKVHHVFFERTFPTGSLKFKAPQLGQNVWQVGFVHV